jgi:hypothetical protein
MPILLNDWNNQNNNNNNNKLYDTLSRYISNTL